MSSNKPVEWPPPLFGRRQATVAHHLRADLISLSLRVVSDHSLIDFGIAALRSRAPGWWAEHDINRRTPPGGARRLLALCDHTVPKMLGRFQRNTRPRTSRRLSVPVDPQRPLARTHDCRSNGLRSVAASARRKRCAAASRACSPSRRGTTALGSGFECRIRLARPRNTAVGATANSGETISA
jgi:hypothetical protein